MSLNIIEKLCEKFGDISISELERKYGVPKRTFFNVKYGNRGVPKKYLAQMINDLTSVNEKELNTWHKLSEKRIRKGVFPKWLLKLKSFCKQENITVDELISGYEKFKMVSK